MTEALGWLAAIVSLLGHALAARGDRRGWLVRVAAGALWLWFGLLRGTPQYVAISVIYLALDLYGWRRRVRAKLAQQKRHM